MKKQHSGTHGETMKTIKTDTHEYELVCGMEIHAELKTNSKMFCSCKNDPFNAPQPNMYTCPVCLGMPGGLPVANKKAIELTVKVGLALGCKINVFSKFDRKNYFYPDLPKAYQISQYDIPFCYDGVVETSHGPIKITRIHLEEDTGKLLHTTLNGKKVSLIDFNRSSVPLIEIVSEPDIRHPEQAKEYAKKIRDVLRYLDAADCDMDQGGMRLEANISLREVGSTSLPTYKVEVKNINSFRFAQLAIDYEMTRQSQLLEANTIPPQETRGYDSVKGITFSQRTKEDAQDYRYFPDPDLPPIRFSHEKIEQLRSELPELPEQIALRWKKEFGIEERYTELLVFTTYHAKILEESFKIIREKNGDPNKLANMLANKKIATLNFSHENSSVTVNEIVTAYLTFAKTDDVSEDELVSVITTVLTKNQDAVAKYKAGETKVIGFFIGQILRTLGKKVSNTMVTELLLRELQK